MAPSPDPQKLNYASKPSIIRRWRWRIVFATLAVVIGLLAWLRGPAVWNRALLLYGQRLAMGHSAPRDSIIYAGKPGPASIDRQAATRQPVPWCWQQVRRDLPLLTGLPSNARAGKTQFADTAPVYLHRAGAGSGDRLIVVQYCNYYEWPLELHRGLNVRVVQPGTWNSPPRWCSEQTVGTGLLPGWSHIVFAGQVDPADSNHFTVEGFTGTLHWEVHGRLQKDDSVTLDCQLLK